MNQAVFLKLCQTRQKIFLRRRGKNQGEILFTANAAGETEVPIVIGKAASQRGFKIGILLECHIFLMQRHGYEHKH